jgi:hypothetical protein
MDGHPLDKPGPYKSTGTPLTPHERELVEILQEECAEVIRECTDVIQSAAKLLRFGKGGCYRDGIENTEKLGLECGDLTEMIQELKKARIISNDDVWKGQLRKKERLHKYLQNRPVQSTAQESGGQ